MEVLLGGDDAPDPIPPASVLVQPGDDPHHVDEAPGVPTDADRGRGNLDALGVRDHDLQTRLEEADGIVPALTHSLALGTPTPCPAASLRMLSTIRPVC